MKPLYTGLFIGKSDKLKQQEAQYHSSEVSTLFRKRAARISQKHMGGRLLSANRVNVQTAFSDLPEIILRQLLQSLPRITYIKFITD